MTETPRKWTQAELVRELREIDAIVDRILLLERRERQQKPGGFVDFVRYHWPTIEPGTTMVEGWPLEAVCEHLEATARDDLQKLLVNVPPGFMKSLLTNVFLPAYIWGPLKQTHMRFVSFSYAATLTRRDNRRLRDILQSERYQEDWPHVVLTSDGEERISIQGTGWKLATSIGGVGTGERGDYILLDDPHNVADQESKVIRESTVDWFRHAMQNRLNDIERSKIIVIMQRVNEGDVSGCILENGMQYEHLMIPMEFDSSRVCETSIGWRDPRTEDGELAWPERFPEEKVEELREAISDYAYAGQYQQEPEVKGGAIFRRTDWQLWGNPDDPEDPAYVRFPIFDYVLAYLDGAYTEKEENDPSAMTVWGVFRDHEKRKPAVMLVYGWRARLQLHELVEKSFRVCSKMRVNCLIIENKASGISVSQELRRLFPGADFGVILDEPVGDKVARAHAVSHLWNSGQIWAPDKDWAQMVIDEMAVFPKGRYKDLTDSATGAMKRLRDLGLLKTNAEELVEAAESVQYRSGKYVQRPLYPGAMGRAA